MTLSIKNISKTIRFRRWSRYQFAAFQSIGKCVNIGCVCKSIIDISLKKQKGILYTPEKSGFTCHSEVDENDEDTPPNTSFLFKKSEILPVIPSNDIPYCIYFLLYQIETEDYCLSRSFRSFFIKKYDQKIKRQSPIRGTFIEKRSILFA